MSTQLQHSPPGRRTRKTTTSRAKKTQVVEGVIMPKRRLFCVRDFRAMGEAGVLREDDRVELIGGEIIERSSIGPSHAACVKRLNHLLSFMVGQQAIVSIQDPVQIGDLSEPQPDLALLKYRADFYAGKHPKAADVLLVMEVADSSARYDREVKIPLYAEAKIAQALLIDLQAGVVEVYARPAKGRYTSVFVRQRGQSVGLQKLPGIRVTVDEILG